jgi:SWI2/SNF2 ATPase
VIGLRKDGKDVFDSIIVITDRRVLDKQIRETIKGFAQVSSIIGAVKDGDGVSKTKQLAKFLKDGKKIIISTVQTFPFVLDAIGEEHRGKNATPSTLFSTPAWLFTWANSMRTDRLISRARQRRSRVPTIFSPPSYRMPFPRGKSSRCS